MVIILSTKIGDLHFDIFMALLNVGEQTTNLSLNIVLISDLTFSTLRLS